MNRAATRARWLEMRRARESARRGRDLLDEKREALVREILRARRRREEALEAALAADAEARRQVADAEVELGTDAVDSAALAQSSSGGIRVARRSLLGVPLPAVEDRIEPLRILYSAGGTSAALDAAAAAHHRLVRRIVALAGEQAAAAQLERALAKTARRLHALERVILPRIESDIRAIESALEEEARDEAFRLRRRRATRQLFDASAS
jgi:V/A-type H+-transporting ATPase subunit D